MARPELPISAGALMDSPIVSIAGAASHGGRWARAHTREELRPHLAARWWWQAARRDEVRVARGLYRTAVGDGVDRRAAGAWRNAGFGVRPELGGADGWSDVQGTAIQRAMVPFVQEIWRDRLKTLCGIESRPAWLCRAAAPQRGTAWSASRLSRGGREAVSGGPPPARGRAPRAPSARRPWPRTSSSCAGGLSRPCSRAGSTPWRRLGS